MCLYSGMDMYVKRWILLLYPIYLILIATSLILGSRYSNKLHCLTHNRALPVLATLLLLMYTSILQAIASVPLYTTIIKSLFQECLGTWPNYSTIWLEVFTFNPVYACCSLCFCRCSMPYCCSLSHWWDSSAFINLNHWLLLKDRSKVNIILGWCTAVYPKYHNVTFCIWKTIGVMPGCLIILTTATILCCIQPNKEKLINFQELTLLYNYVVVCILMMFIDNEEFSVITVNVMVGLS